MAAQTTKRCAVYDDGAIAGEYFSLVIMFRSGNFVLNRKLHHAFSHWVRSNRNADLIKYPGHWHSFEMNFLRESQQYLGSVYGHVTMKQQFPNHLRN